ncbi:hypothetical protein D3C79_676760 [compost metagenome]
MQLRLSRLRRPLSNLRPLRLRRSRLLSLNPCPHLSRSRLRRPSRSLTCHGMILPQLQLSSHLNLRWRLSPLWSRLRPPSCKLGRLFARTSRPTMTTWATARLGWSATTSRRWTKTTTSRRWIRPATVTWMNWRSSMCTRRLRPLRPNRCLRRCQRLAWRCNGWNYSRSCRSPE